MKLKKTLSILIAVVLIMCANLFFYRSASAFFGFGGTIGSITVCDNGTMISIGLPTTGLYLLPQTAKIYPYNSIMFGSWVLGLSAPIGACVIGQAVIPVKGTILYLGTSR